MSTNSIYDQVVHQKNVVSSITYNGRKLHIWRENKESVEQGKNSSGFTRFYVTPLCEILPETAELVEDDYSGKDEYLLRFSIRFWDSKLTDLVKNTLKQHSVNTNQCEILPLPMQMIRLKVKESPNFYTDEFLRPNHDQPNVMTFDIYSQNKDFCQKMLNDLQNSTQKFLSNTKMTLEFTMVLSHQASRRFEVTGKMIAKTKFFTQLMNEHGDKGYVYMNSTDLNKLGRDIFRTIQATDFTTSDYVSNEDEDKLIRTLCENNLKDQEIQTSNLTKEEWNSVFWDNIFTRPDVQEELFNDIFAHDEGANEFKFHSDNYDQNIGKIRNKYASSNENSFNFDVGAKGILSKIASVTAKGGGDSKNTSSSDEASKHVKTKHDILTKDQMEDFMKETKSTMKWTGQKFEQKNLNLSRVNLRELCDERTIIYQSVNMTTIAETYKIEIHPPPASYSTETKKSSISLNFLVIGECGSGKTTLINSISNYLKFESLIEAKEAPNPLHVIGGKFKIADENEQIQEINIGNSPNEGPNGTLDIEEYDIDAQPVKLKLIDTPGIGFDSNKDIHTVKNIISVASVKNIDAIFIVLNCNVSENQSILKNGLKNLLINLDAKNCLKNVFFVFTKTSPYYRPGNTLEMLKKIVEDSNVVLLIESSKIMSVDNEAFRFLHARKANVQFSQMEMKKIEKSWSHSAAETKRILAQITNNA